VNAKRKVRLATVWLDGCSGCHMSILDMDEAILALARRVDVVYGPLVDAQEFPKSVDVAIVEGAVSSQDDLEKIRAVRQRSKLVVALGDCAVTGNVPAMRNPVPVRQLLERIYIQGAQENPGIPADGVPSLLRQAVPVHEVVAVDLHVAGCPPPAASIAFVLNELLDGRIPDLSAKVKFG
jgi:NAD-reducing hydrogenase small subunit